MSLLTDSMEKFVLMDKTSQSDGRGGIIYTWKEGADFQAALTFDSSMQAKIGETLGVTALYTITTTKAVNLSFHDIVKQDSTGEYYRVTSKSDFNNTPPSAGLNMKQVNAESYILTGDLSGDNDG